MKVLLVSTFQPQKCGIADYTVNLAAALEQQSGVTVDIGSEWHAQSVKQQSVYPVWQRRGNSLDGIFKLVRERKHDVVHLQHEFGLFPDQRVWARLLDQLATETQICVTLHTVLLPSQRVEFFEDLAQRTHVRCVVHTLAAQAALGAWGVTNTTVIPHAAVTRTPLEPDHARAQLRLPAVRSIGLCPGFLSPGKGHSDIIAAFAKASTVKDRLIIAGLSRDPGYTHTLEQLIDHHGLNTRVVLDPTYQDPARRHSWFSAADYFIFGARNYKRPQDAPLSASGQVATAIAYRRPIIAKNVPIYQDSAVSVLYDNVASCAAYLQAAMTHSIQCPPFPNARTWEKAAEVHRGIYEG